MRKISRLLLVIFALMGFASGALGQDRLVIEGTGDSQKLLRQLAKAYEARNPGDSIVVPDSVGSSGGVKALVKGKCDMARVARPLKDKEKAMAADLSYREFAYSPVVFAANLPERCIESLSSAQVVGIFSGAISDWSQLGRCEPHKIYLAMREAGDSSRSVLEKKIPGLKDIAQVAGKVIYSTPETVQTIEEYPYTLGFLPQAPTSAKMITMAYNGVSPDEAAVSDGSYPLVSPFALVWRGELGGLGARFLDFVLSAEGKQVIRAAGVVPASASR